MHYSTHCFSSSLRRVCALLDEILKVLERQPPRVVRMCRHSRHEGEVRRIRVQLSLRTVVPAQLEPTLMPRPGVVPHIQVMWGLHFQVRCRGACLEVQSTCLSADRISCGSPSRIKVRCSCRIVVLSPRNRTKLSIYSGMLITYVMACPTVFVLANDMSIIIRANGANVVELAGYRHVLVVSEQHLPGLRPQCGRPAPL